MYYLKITFNKLPKVIMAHRVIHQDYHLPDRLFDAMELVYVEEGECLITIHDRFEFIVSPGEIYICPPNMLHTCKTVSSRVHHIHSTIGVVADFGYELLDETAFQNHKYLHFSEDTAFSDKDFIILPFHYKPDKKIRIEERYNFFNREYIFNDYFSSQIISSKFVGFISEIARDFFESLKVKDNKHSAASNFMYSKKIIEYITDNYTKQLDLNMLAGYVGLSPNYICNIFKKVTNETIIGYLNMVRIKKAKELMLNSQLNINQICEMIGIENWKYFSELFKKYEGISPKQYRTLIK